MKISILFSILFLILSCSVTQRANRHLKRAIKLDPTIVHITHDTIIKTISDTGNLYFYGDTIVENNLVFISVKHEGLKTNLYWFLKSINIEVPVENTTIIPPLSNKEIRWKYKTKIQYIKQKGKTERVEIRQTNKSERKKLVVAKKKYFNWFFIGIIIGILIGLVLYKTLSFYMKKLLNTTN